MHQVLRGRFATLSILALLLATTLFWTGCGTENDTLTSPRDSQNLPTSDTSVFGMRNPVVASAMKVQTKATPMLMQVPGVIGTATSVDSHGTPYVMVLTETQVPAGNLPTSVDGLKVVPHFSGKIVAMKGRPGGGGGGGGGVSHTAKQSTPIQLGTSGGWTYDLANGYCCAGTLGSLIQIGSKQYILSNYHVLEADIVSGGNGRVASNGDPVIQPGLIDSNCDNSNANVVASLALRHALPNNNVDCAIAEVVPGMVDAGGAILEIGTLSSQTVGASVGQAVKKSGRTTGLTRSSVSGLNATISVSYENECAGGSAFTKTFTGQIVIQNKRSKFLDGGDSGSLMVEDVSSNPRAVGLLFAGSRFDAIANPIGDVLGFLNASMVGN